MKTYAKFGILTVLIIGSLVWLAAGGIRDTKTYYKTVPELRQMGKSAEGQRLRVGGNVVSISKEGTRVAFVLHQGTDQLNVVYAGNEPLPDTFKPGAIALADGRLSSDGTFEASKVQAKCASKYESKPTQKGLSHESPAGTKISQTRALPTVVAKSEL